VVVGAGLSGLTCALTMVEAGLDVSVLEASDGVGGRVRTDAVDGFLLDRGFQVLLDAYPEAGRRLDLAALDLHAFHPGAVVRKGGRMHVVADPFRQPIRAIRSLFAPVGSFADKLLVARLRMESLRAGSGRRLRHDLPTRAALEQYGFSARMIETFFRPFLGGVFLERELETSAAKLAFVFRMFAMGRATVPAQGMSGIPAQLARRLEGRIRTGCRVTAVSSRILTLATGGVLEADAVILAVDEANAARLTGIAPPARMKHVTTIHFDAPAPPVEGPWLVLNGDGDGVVNHLAVMSEVSADYAPAGRSLVSVTTLSGSREGIETRVTRELEGWFGRAVRKWRHLRTDHIVGALPEESSFSAIPPVRPPADGVWLCGDYTGNASIEGAILSGRLTAEALLETL
jgi:phytoene dehydrogenase-like protein